MTASLFDTAFRSLHRPRPAARHPPLGTPGVPQIRKITFCVGGVASPALANMALDGLEAVAHKAAAHNQKINVIRYADDFVITGASKEVLETRIKPAVVAFLEERGPPGSRRRNQSSHNG